MNDDALTRCYVSLINKYFPAVEVCTYSAIVKGWDCFVVEINRAYIFRFARRPEIRSQLEKEALLLPRLAGALQVPVPNPEFICTDPRTDDPAFVGYRMIHGEHLVRDHLSCDRAARLARQLGCFLSQLHGFPIEEASRLGIPLFGPSAWRQRYEALYSWIARAVWPFLEAPIRRKLSLLWRSFLDRWVDSGLTPELVHGDLSADHILYNSSQVLIAGVIDWGDAVIGDAALDFAGLLYDYGPEFTQQVLAAYRCDVDNCFWQRAAFYSNSHLDKR